MAKMGISTIRSYRGAKIFESIGLSEHLLKTYFGTEISTIGGIGLEKIAADAIAMHQAAFAHNNIDTSLTNGRDSLRSEGSKQASPSPRSIGAFLPNLGQFHWRKDGIKHAWNPETIAKLQLATRTGKYE